MFGTLRNRLLASYVAILLILLVLVGLFLLAFLATRPVPTSTIIRDLSATLLDINLTEGMWAGGGQGRQGAAGSADTQPLSDAALQQLNAEAEEREIRILLLTNSGELRFDSAGTLAEGTPITLSEFVPLMTPRHGAMNAVFQGQFIAPGAGEWLFVAQSLRFPGEMHGERQYFLVVAVATPRQTLPEVFDSFGETFFAPLAQAGAIGLIIALALSVVIAGSVAGPLQAIGRAARRIADGDYRQRVPVQGPREVRGLAAAFNDMAARVATAQETQREFLANVSHDLRTPLTSIQGFSQAIVEGVAAEPASAQRAAQIIHDEASRMHRMVESLLELARIEAGVAGPRQTALALQDVLEPVVESLSVRAKREGVALQLDLAADLPRVLGDRDRLAQVFTNLIDNALQHTPAGGSIRLAAQANGAGVRVTVEDSGEGIPAADLPRLFERFYRVDKSRHRDVGSGTGLGLAIAKQVVEAHGGTIGVTSREGAGTTVTIWLPSGDLSSSAPH